MQICILAPGVHTLLLSSPHPDIVPPLFVVASSALPYPAPPPPLWRLTSPPPALCCPPSRPSPGSFPGAAPFDLPRRRLYSSLPSATPSSIHTSHTSLVAGTSPSPTTHYFDHGGFDHDNFDYDGFHHSFDQEPWLKPWSKHRGRGGGGEALATGREGRCGWRRVSHQ